MINKDEKGMNTKKHPRSIIFFLSIMCIASGTAFTDLNQELTNTIDQQNSLPPLPIIDASQSINKQNQSTLQGDAKNRGEAKKDIFFNFENTDLINFINYMAEIRKLNIIPDKTLEGAKISLTIRDPLTADGAWNIFLSVLEMAGFSLIENEDIYKIIPRDKKLTQALPAYINVGPETLPNSELEIRYVLFLNNIQVADVKDLLLSMLSSPNNVVEQKDANAFIITDKSLNIKAAARLLLELDQMGMQETVAVVRLKRANAADVKGILDLLVKKPEGNPLARLLGKTSEGTSEYFSPGTRIIAEERTNSLVLLGNNASIEKIIDFITKHIDTELQGTESPLHIFELKHTDAQQIMDILKEVTQAPESTIGAQAGKYGAVRGGVKYFKSMKFQVDKDGNRLIVSSTDKQDWKLLKQTIIDLDKPQPQVAIETLIVSVSVDDAKSLGGMLRNKKHGQIGHNIDFQSAALTGNPSLEPVSSTDTTPVSLLGSLLNQLVAAQGATVLSFGKKDNIWGVFRMLKSQVNATLLSQPFVTVANKTSASIEVGETKRVVAEEGDARQSFTEIPVKTSIQVQPQINLEGLIRMDMNVTIEDFVDTAGNIRNTKNLKTNVTVADGQVLVLGGFVKTKVDESKSKTPLLGDIPILGWLFKSQERTVKKEYIFIFMAPTIIKPRQIPGIQMYTKMKMHDATNRIEEAIETKRTHDPIHNWFFNPAKENYSHKVIDFANARYQPTTVDIRNDPYYRSQTIRQEIIEEQNERRDQEQPFMALKTSDNLLQGNGSNRTLSKKTNTSTQTPAIATEQQFIEPLTIQIPTKESVPNQQTGALTEEQALDYSLQEKRDRLKQLLSDQHLTDNNADNKPIDRSPTSSPRELFKDMITPQNQAQEDNLVNQRNQFKDFLALRTSADRSAHNSESTAGRKVSV